MGHRQVGAGGVTVRAARPGDGRELAALLRAEDRSEIEAARGPVDAAEVLESAIALPRSEVLLVASTRAPVALFGVSERSRAHGRAHARLWMLGSDEVARRPRDVIELARAWVPALCRDAVGWNWIDSRNEMHLRFLRYLGADIYPALARTFYDASVPFWPFTLEPSLVRPPHRDRRHRRSSSRVELRGRDRAGEDAA